MVEGTSPTWLSLLPAITAMFFAFVTKRVLLALSLSIAVGGVVLAIQMQSLSGLNVVAHFFMPALISKSFATILIIYLFCLGTITGMWNKTGGAQHFAEVLGSRIAKGPRSSMLFTWLIGMVFHQGGSISTVLAGTTAKPVADKHRVSHEELSYVVDSTASPIATIIPFNAWPMYVSGVVMGTIPLLPDMETSYHFYLKSVIFNYYPLVAVMMTFLFAMEWLPWIGKRMKEARQRARTTGQLDHFSARPMIVTTDAHVHLAVGYRVGLIDFLLPIGLLLCVAVIPFSLWQFGVIGPEYANQINNAFLVAALSAVILAMVKGMSAVDVIRGVYQGSRSMGLGAVIISLAITVGLVTRELGAAQYLIAVTDGALPMWALPAILTVLCMIVAFATGTSWGTYAVVYPVALPLAYTLSTDPTYISICFGAILGGTVFGDQCSPISDTTILSSMFTGCDLMDHVRTQLPLALVAALIAGSISTFLMFALGYY